MRCPTLLLLALPVAALAQPGGERLPDLTPSTFEVTGDLTISLPELERQPLSGFGPPPRTYIVPAERQPATRPYGPPLDGLRPLALAAPADPAAARPLAHRFRAEGGFGVGVSRYGRLDAALAGPSGVLTFDLDYDGAGESVTFGDEGPTDPDPEVRFASLRAQGGYRTTGAVQLGLGAAAARDDYSLPGVLGSTTGALPERTVTHVEASAFLSADETTAAPAGLRLRVARTDPETRGLPSLALSTATTETRLDGAAHVELFRRLVRVDGTAGLGSFLPDTGTDLRHYTGGLVFQTHRPGGARFQFGARVLGYATSFENGDASTTVIAPVARIEAPVGSTTRLYAFTDPGLTQRGLYELLLDNPYADPVPLAPDVHTVDAEAGIEVRSGAVGVRAWAGGAFSPTRLFFERDAATGLFVPAYGRARTLEGGFDVTLATASGVEFSAGGAYRDGALTEFDEALPYFASVTGRAGVQLPFAGERGTVSLAAYAEGSRPADRGGLTDLPAWGLLTLDAAYEIGAGLSVVARGERLAGRSERWQGYPQAPYAVMGGLRLVR